MKMIDIIENKFIGRDDNVLAIADGFNLRRSDKAEFVDSSLGVDFLNDTDDGIDDSDD